MPKVMNPFHLLVMEDDAALAHVLRALLAHVGMTSETAPARNSAFQRDLSRFSAILLDVPLSLTQSRNLIEQTRARYSRPLIVFSETLSGDDRTKALEAGADYVLQKPFFPGELLAIIRSVLQSKASVVPFRAVRQRRGLPVTRSSVGARGAKSA
jgi:two-component system OmpR family response regulator